MSWACRAALCLSVCMSLVAPAAVLADPPARAQRGQAHKPRVKGARAPKPKRERRAPTARPGERVARARGKARREHAEQGPARAAQAAQAAAASSSAQIVKEGDTSVKVMSFEGLGIEGRLKSPQLAYFVQRVQAEFQRPTLPHRSFMPELADSTAREPVR